jgi:hypothetical protein
MLSTVSTIRLVLYSLHHKKDRYDSLTKAVFMPSSYDQDKAIKSIAFWKGAIIKGFF